MTKIREGYKETEIGIIPEEWAVDYLNNLSIVIGDGLHGTPKYCDEGVYCFINGNNLKNGYIVLTNETKKIDYEEYKKYKVDLRDSSILISLNGTIGSLAFYNEENIILSKSAGYITLNEKQDKSYIYQVLQSKYVKDFILKELTGTTIRNLSLKTLRHIPIAIAPIAEQKCIAEILSTTDALIEKLDKTIADYQLLKKGMMKKLLTEGIGHTEFKETEIGRIPKEWEVQDLSDICNINPSSLAANEDANRIIKYIDIESVSTGRIGKPKEMRFGESPSRARRVVQKQDVIISTVRPYLKAFAPVELNDEDLICSTGFAVLRPNENVDHRFLYQTTISDLFINQLLNKMVGSNYPAINSTDLKSTVIPIPDFLEQQKIANVLSTFDERIDILSNEREEMICLKKALMERLLTGKVRLI